MLTATETQAWTHFKQSWDYKRHILAFICHMGPGETKTQMKKEPQMMLYAVQYWARTLQGCKGRAWQLFI